MQWWSGGDTTLAPEEWFTGRAADRFGVVFPYLPGALDDFAVLVTPGPRRESRP